MQPDAEEDHFVRGRLTSTSIRFAVLLASRPSAASIASLRRRRASRSRRRRLAVPATESRSRRRTSSAAASGTPDHGEPLLLADDLALRVDDDTASGQADSGSDQRPEASRSAVTVFCIQPPLGRSQAVRSQQSREPSPPRPRPRQSRSGRPRSPGPARPDRRWRPAAMTPNPASPSARAGVVAHTVAASDRLSPISVTSLRERAIHRQRAARERAVVEIRGVADGDRAAADDASSSRAAGRIRRCRR